METEIAERIEDYKKQNEELKTRNRNQFDQYLRESIRQAEKIKDLQELARHHGHHTEVLDKNWEAHHEATLKCLKDALEVDTDLSIPAMVAKIEYLVARDHINDSLESLRKDAMIDEDIEELMR